MLIGKYILVIFHSLFVIRNFWGYMLMYRNAEGVHGHRQFDNTCSKPKPSTVGTGEL